MVKQLIPLLKMLMVSITMSNRLHYQGQTPRTFKGIHGLYSFPIPVENPDELRKIFFIRKAFALAKGNIQILKSQLATDLNRESMIEKD